MYAKLISDRAATLVRLVTIRRVNPDKTARQPFDLELVDPLRADCPFHISCTADGIAVAKLRLAWTVVMHEHLLSAGRTSKTDRTVAALIYAASPVLLADPAAKPLLDLLDTCETRQLIHDRIELAKQTCI